VTRALKVVEQGIREHWPRGMVLDAVVETLHEEHPHYHWVGVYLLEGDTLVLGPYRGKPTAHTGIRIGEGICGLAARVKRTVNVQDVSLDERYIACTLETRSEIVVPIMNGDVVYGEIDIDSDDVGAFGARDEALLEQVAEALAPLFHGAK